VGVVHVGGAFHESVGAARTRRLRRAGFLLLLGRWGGAELPHHPALVGVVPALHYLALGEAEDADAGDLQRVACGRDAPELSPVGPANRPAGDNLVAFGDLVFDLGVEVGEGFVELAHEPLYVLGTSLQRGAVGLVSEVAVEDLVRQLQLPLVAHLLYVAPEDSLVLLSGHPPPPFHHRFLAPIPYARSLQWRNESFDPPRPQHVRHERPAPALPTRLL